MAGPGSQVVGRRWATLVAAVVLVPFVAFLVWALTTTIRSGGDVALTEVAVRDIGGAHTPLLGAYSRYGWHHPGPLLFVALAVPYRLLGTDGSALAAGMVLLNALAVAGSLALLWRRGRLGGVVVGGLAIAILVHSLGGAVITSPWNPVATVLPLLCFVLAVWSVTCGDVWMLPVVVAIGSLVVQTHVGTALVVLVGGVTACGAVVVSRRRRPGGDRRLWVVSVAAGVVLWIPPVVDALRHRGGNLRALFDFWTAGHDHLTGWAHAARIVGAELAVDPPWVTGRLPQKAFVPGVDPGWTFPVFAVAFVVALVVAVRRARPDAVRLGGVTIGFALVTWVSVARIVDEPLDYLVRWTELTGVLVSLTIGWTVLELVGGAPSVRAARVRDVLGALAVGVTVVLTAVTTVRALDAPPALGEQRVYDRIAPRLARAARALPAPVVLYDHGDISSAGLTSSVLNGLLAAGVDARFPDRLAWQVGPQHVTAHPRTRVLVVYGDDSARLRTDPRYRVLAAADELDPAQRAELDRLRSSFSGLADEVRWMRRHPAAARRLAELSDQSARGVVLVERS